MVHGINDPRTMEKLGEATWHYGEQGFQLFGLCNDFFEMESQNACWHK